MNGRLDFEFVVKHAPKPLELESDDEVMSIVVLADLSGRSARGVLEIGEGLAERPIVRIDHDQIEARLDAYAPQIDVTLPGGGTVRCGVRRFSDFHPDSLVADLASFQTTRDLRRRLMDPATFAAAAAELRSESAPVPPPSSSAAPAAPDGDLLERLLGRRSEAPVVARGTSPTGGADISAFVRSLVGSQFTPAADPSRDQLVALVEEGLSSQLRALLHAPQFQELESVWRGLGDLIAELDLDDERLTIRVIDVSKDELLEDIRAADLPERSGLAKLLERAGSGHALSVVVGAYTFGASGDDIALLAAIGHLTSRSRAPFLAGAAPALLGLPSLPWSLVRGSVQELDPTARTRFDGLRQASVASWIGLALPRLLLRTPYGKRSDPIDAFPFEECPSPIASTSLLWGSPVFGLARLLAETFLESGFDAAPGTNTYLRDRPAVTMQSDGEQVLVPAAEAYLSDAVVEQVLEMGLMPFISHKNHNVVRLARFQSIARPARALSGPWR